jgi:hypothetical protein
MGITNSNMLEGSRSIPEFGSIGKNFSEDVLKIEISGPSRPHFSITDVPGVFHSCTVNLTEAEKDQVTNMVSYYMTPKRSIIMCVSYRLNGSPSHLLTFLVLWQLQRTILQDN